MAIPDHPIIWTVGADPRCAGHDVSEWAMGRIRTNDLSPVGFISSIASQIPNFQYTTCRPYVVASAPFTVDQLGNSFPAGTVWVVYENPGIGSNPASMRTIGASGNGSTTIDTSFWFPGVSVDIVYRCAGVPAGATGSVTLTYNSTVVCSFTVSGPTTGVGSIVHPISGAFAIGSSGYGIVVASTWSFGTPNYESIVAFGPGSTTNTYVAVPGTLPAGYTPRTDTDLLRGGSLNKRYQAGPKRLGVKPNIPYSNYGLAIGYSLPAVENNGYVWIGGQPQIYSWLPQAVNTNFITSVSGGVVILPNGSAIPYGGSASVIQGMRTAQIVMSVSGTVPLNTTVSVTIYQDGVELYSASYSNTSAGGNNIVPGTVSLGAILPSGAPGTTTTLTMTTAGAGVSSSSEVQAGWTIEGSPRCDIPLPMSCAGASGTIYPGGYVPSALSTVIGNTQPLYRVTGSVYSQGAQKQCLQWSPPIDSWYTVVVSGSPIAGVGEDAFGYLDTRSISRGHAGRPFYCLASTINATYTLTPHAPTSMTITANGTTIDMSPAGGLGWGTITVPTDGEYSITIGFVDAKAMALGLIVSTSITDPTVCDYTTRYVWEPIDELLNAAYLANHPAQILSAPPATPSTTQLVIVGPNPTGIFAGHVNDLAVWDAIGNAYVYVTPTTGTLHSVAYPYLWNGVSWLTSGGAAFTVRAFITAAHPLYVGLEVFTTENTGGNYAAGKVTLSYLAST